jgi:hypothetical protein
MMPDFDIHIQCAACDGSGNTENLRHGVDANGPWVDITDQECPECEGGLRYVGREYYDSVTDLRADYPTAFARNLETKGWA